MSTKTFFTPVAGNEGCRRLPVVIEVAPVAHGSNAKIRFQSFFMLMTVQPSFFASSYSAWVKAPTLVSGSPWAGP